MEFDIAPMDTGTRWLTFAVVIVIVGIAIFIAAVEEMGALRVPFLVMNATILFFAWALAPRRYVLHGRHRLEVQRNAWRSFEAQIDGPTELDDIRRFGFRIVGSGGGFGWYGRFRRRDIGMYRLFASTRDRAHLVALDGPEGIVVISPADRTAFLQTLSS